MGNLKLDSSAAEHFLPQLSAALYNLLIGRLKIHIGQQSFKMDNYLAATD